MPEIPIPPASAAAISLFACMTRFEFALKEAGFVAGSDGGNATPDWTGFGDWAAERGAFDQLISNTAIRILIDEPPRKQVRRGSSFEWSDPLEVRNLYELSTAIRQVRNNLFHGGKAGADPRDDALCEAATAALLFLADFHPGVRAAFLGEF